MPKKRATACHNSPTFQQLWDTLGSKLTEAAREQLPSKQWVVGSNPTRDTTRVLNTLLNFSHCSLLSFDLPERTLSLSSPVLPPLATGPGSSWQSRQRHGRGQDAPPVCYRLGVAGAGREGALCPYRGDAGQAQEGVAWVVPVWGSLVRYGLPGPGPAYLAGRMVVSPALRIG